MSEEEAIKISHVLNCAKADLEGAVQLLGSEGHGELCLRTIKDIAELLEQLKLVEEEKRSERIAEEK